MIFVTLGTQDKQFKRLLEAVDKLDINEKIIAQIGSTDFASAKMEIYKYMSIDEFTKYINEARVVITHAGAGTITLGLKLHKKMIVAARRKEYKEHVNDHQMQILENFSNEGYIMPLKNFDDLEKLINEDFSPKEYNSNREEFINKLDNEIKELTKKKI